MVMDQKQHAEYIRKFCAIQPRLKILAETLEDILKQIVKTAAPFAIVQSRVKAVSSFSKKIARKQYDDPFHKMTDLCGARIITLTREQMQIVCHAIEEKGMFQIDWENSLDVSSRLRTAEFGYRSFHYVVQIPFKQVLDVPIPPEVLASKRFPFKAEIQVKTLLQHGWAEIVHDRLYKNRVHLPASLERDAARLAAILEEADQVLSEMVQHIDEYNTDIGAYGHPEEIKDELSNLRLIYSYEKKESEKETQALLMAKMNRAIHQWKEIVRLLTPFKKGDNPKLLRELGNALCKEWADHTDNPLYTEGQRLLEESLKRDPNDAETHTMLARSHQRRVVPDWEERVRIHFKRAFELEPTNPYHVADYLESELLISTNNLSFVMPLTPTIRAAVDTCRKHVRAGIELPKAFWTMGRLSLFLVDASSAIGAYTKAVRMYLDRDVRISPRFIHSEEEMVSRLSLRRGSFPGEINDWESLLQSVKRLLLLAKHLDPNSLSGLPDLHDLKHLELPPGKPVLIVAGGCDQTVSAEIQRFKPALHKALQHFNGIVVGGGTTAGISGILGEIALETRKRSFHLIGYHPAHFPANCQLDSRYDALAMSPGRGFSPLEILQALIDTFAAGIPLDKVQLLGIGGGPIALAEYRLALALGISVGLIKDSGRAVDELLKDPDWNGMGNLISLPDDPMTIHAFLNQGDPVFLPEKLEKAARACHTAFIENNKDRIYTDSFKPWETLDETYKSSNRMQMAYVGVILSAHGFKIIPKSNSQSVRLIHFRDDEVEKMAEYEHGRWNVDRLKDGWRYGAKKDVTNKIHPYLVPWKDLDDSIKQYDRDAVRSWPQILKDAGMEIRRAAAR